VNEGFGYGLAFAAGVLGALHCLGMCGGIAAGFFARAGRRRLLLTQVYYQGTRILTYSVLGVAGAMVGRVLVQAGALGKVQGLLMLAAGVLITLVGVAMLRRRPPPRRREASCTPPLPGVRTDPWTRPWTPLAGGLLNGLVPCGLVFSVAVKAAATADPFRAALLMAAFGLGTLPGLGAAGMLGAGLGRLGSGTAARLAGLLVVALGLWTLHQGAAFFHVMRGLSNG
jgi:sulfite exporter TauE/SafE